MGKARVMSAPPNPCRKFAVVVFRSRIFLDQELIFLLMSLFFFLFLLERPLQKSPLLRHFKSDQNDIWQDCSSRN